MKIRPTTNGDEPKTLLSRFGFQDGDLKTPQHDEMMLWLDEHHAEIVGRLVGREWSQRPATIEEMEAAREAWMAQRARRGYGLFTIEQFEEAWPGLVAHPPKIGARIKRVTWEVPVMSGKFTVGFIDMVVDWVATTSASFGDMGQMLWVKDDAGGEVCFEVKSSIPSLGELIRQIRMYEPHVDGDFVVVCADDRFAVPLKRQGIGFVTYLPF